MKRHVIGISGRSGSGKTTIVKDSLAYFGDHLVTLHTMDDYYRDRSEHKMDEEGYLNFDLPSALNRGTFHYNLKTLISGYDLEIMEYIFNNESVARKKTIKSTPVILVEGLFVFYYEEVRKLLDKRVLVDLGFKRAYKRRLTRDITERNSTEEEVIYRYHNHVEPAYRQYIAPYIPQMDLVISTKNNSGRATQQLIELIASFL